MPEPSADRDHDAGGGQPGSELDLQRRWAEARWPAPFLETQAGVVRLIAPGRWNRGPGPDFRGAQILDANGRARRGDVELHLEPQGWLAHGHDSDPAYDGLLLHLVAPDTRATRSGPDSGSGDPRIPEASVLPEPPLALSAEPPPPCADIVERAGASAVAARLTQIAEQRFRRKVEELRVRPVPAGPGSTDDRRALAAAARALGQPSNARLSEQAAFLALSGAQSWAAVRMTPPADGWRRGRGALGTPDGFALVWMTLLQRWTTQPDGQAGGSSGPWAAFQRLVELPAAAAADELRVERRLGSSRACQLLADAVYPLAATRHTSEQARDLAWQRWQTLPGARYQRTDELRDRLDDQLGQKTSRVAKLKWRHPQTQALLELEATRCRQWACRVCPLAALAHAAPRGSRGSRGSRGG